MPNEIRTPRVNNWMGVAALGMACVLAISACGKKEEAAKPAPGAQPAAGVSPQVVAPAAPEITVPELLGSATRAVNEERLVAPAGNNAIEFYLQVLTKDANNVSATQALVDLFPLAAGNAEREIVNRNLPEAARIVGLLDQASPGSYTVSTLKSKLNAARTQMQREEERRLAQEAAAEQQRAQAAVAAAAPAPTPTPAQPARPAASEPKPVEPKPVEPAPVATAPAQPVAQSRDPVLVRQVRPVYPAAAARRRQEGWVEVSFTVAASGDVTDVNVSRAQPRGVFDRDAVRAVSQWKYEPAMENGKPVSRTLTRRIEFALSAK
ncbi:MAG: TonB family protein [Xanthomonadales bacterium]|nr:TonB family protein [Xanthomonadales bacterium]MBK7145452.1 TonB family protein [Xanthomonadales bacterium]MCC6563238.1 TonB family protein [Xanthomonadales bacterium]